MEINLSGRTALITGGSLGLGFATAKALAQANKEKPNEKPLALHAWVASYQVV